MAAPPHETPVHCSGNKPSRGEAFIREKVKKGTPTLMPGFEYSLEPAQIDQIIAFLKTVAPRDQTAAQD